jgi:carbon storage regulator
MLFLTRKARESLMIGDDIEVFVVSVRGDTVRIGIEAPASAAIFRKEVYLEIKDGEATGDSRRQLRDAINRMKSG